VAYAAETGEELWKAELADGFAAVPRPVYADGLVYVCSGYPRAELAAVRVDGSGDVTKTHIAWTYDRQVPLISSPIIAGGEIYFVSTTGIASCLDTKTGECLWRQRLAGDYAASPLLGDGKLYFTSKQGVTTVIQPGREYGHLAENRIFGQTYSSMAVAGEALLIRTSSSLYSIRKTP
jgi:outer membrane protein assembly factor BamB